jgi:hypothetical protein
MADGSDCAFSSGYQPIIDLSKETLAASLSLSIGSISERLRQAVADLEVALSSKFPSSEQFGEENYSATFIACVVASNQLVTAWIGSFQAKLFRNGVCVNATTPHVTMLPPPQKLAITSKVLSTQENSIEETPNFCSPWDLYSGDIVIIGNYRLFALATDAELVKIVSDVPTSAARCLVEWAESIEHQFAQSAIVVKIEGD